MIDLPSLTVTPRPFAHAVNPAFLPADLYTALAASFPICPPLGGPTGFSYFRGDPVYDELVAKNEAWRALFTNLHSQSFIDYCVGQFSDSFAADGCLLDTATLRYLDHFESRADKAKRSVEFGNRTPEDLWVRVDILQGRIGYRREPHLDHRRRLLTVLIYFCDAQEIDMQGGDLILNERLAGGEFADLEAIAPRHNLMIAFPCSARSYHSVSLIHSQRAPRNFVQVTISSPVDAWSSD